MIIFLGAGPWIVDGDGPAGRGINGDLQVPQVPGDLLRNREWNQFAADDGDLLDRTLTHRR